MSDTDETGQGHPDGRPESEGPITVRLDQLPHDVDAEQCVLGSAMMDVTARKEVLARLRVQDFFDPKHAEIFTAIASLDEDDNPTDPVAVFNNLSQAGTLKRAGGGEYLHTLVSSIPSVASAAYYCEILTSHTSRRELITIGARLAHNAYATANPEQVTSLARKATTDLDAVATLYTVPESFDHLLASTVATLKTNDTKSKKNTPILTGHDALDTAIGGLYPGHVTLITSPASNHAFDLLLYLTQPTFFTRPTLIITPGRKTDLAHHLLSSTSGVPYTSIASATLTADDKREIDKACEALSSTPGVVSTCQLNPGILHPFITTLNNEQALTLVAIDATDLDPTLLARDLKSLAKALNLPIVISTNTGGVLPKDTDHIDTILTYNPSQPDPLTIDKNPHGANGPVPIFYNKTHRTFTTEDPPEYEPVPETPEPSQTASAAMHA